MVGQNKQDRKQSAVGKNSAPDPKLKLTQEVFSYCIVRVEK